MREFSDQGRILRRVTGTDSRIIFVKYTSSIQCIELTDSAQAAEAARRTIEEGVGGIKIYASRPALSESVIRAVVEEAHRAKRPVFVHCNTAEDIQNARYPFGNRPLTA
jgi:hypothetical protein